MSRIYKELDVKLDLKFVFSHPTIEGLSEIIGKMSKTAYEQIVPIPVQPYYDVSHSQKRLWVLDQLEGQSAVYNMPGVYEFRGTLDKSALLSAFESLIERHEILRTTFITVDGELKQRIRSFAESGFRVEEVDLRQERAWEEKAREYAQEESIRPFDLEQGPLLRCVLLELASERSIFLFTMHHIISDGWSMGVLIKEVLSLYEAYSSGRANPLLPLRIQYKDYTYWQNSQLTGEGLKVHRDYWLNQLSGDLPVLDLPTDHARPAIRTHNGSSVSFELDKDLSNSLESFNLRHGVSLFMTLLAGVKALLYRYTGQSDIVVGSPIAGRVHSDLEARSVFI